MAQNMIEADEAESYKILPGRADAGLIVLCDHAGNRFPDGYGALGMADSELRRHIAYDIGAASVTQGISEALGAPAVLTKYSRLLIDPNRGRDDPTLIMRISDGAVVPGNRQIDDAERQTRVERYFEPYHRAVNETIDKCLASGRAPALLSIHSFTPAWKGVPRRWHVAVLWDEDDRLPHPLLAELSRNKELVVGDNEPYTGRLMGDCMWQHGTKRGLAHAIIELRQDLITDDAGQNEWAGRLAAIMDGFLKQPELAKCLAKVHR